MSKSYLIDTNVFIQSKNREYRFDFCEAFWDWLKDGHAQDQLFSCSKVYLEIRNGDPKKICPARKWADAMPSTFFVDDINDPGVMAYYAELMKWASSSKQYVGRAVREFADPDNADAFAVATAKHHNMDLVTHEKASPYAQNRIPIQSAADQLGVNCIQIYDLLSLRATTAFVFKP